MEPLELTGAAADARGEAPAVSIVVPTYREAENLPHLVPRIAAALADAGIPGEILIVDDDSRDATVGVCDRLAEQYPVRLIVRTDERGLSSAVIRGFREARGRILLCMDADLSHPPEAIPALVASLESGGADFVIGSRYVPGASTDESWGAFRWLNSRIATALARPLSPAKDPMAGFFALTRERFEAAESLSPIGYKIGLELLVKCRCRNVQEVPIHFRDRVHGESKLSLREQWNYIVHLKRLYEFKLGRVARPVQFLFVGASGTAVDLASLAVLMRAFSFRPARAVAIGIAMTWNFLLNRRLTFSYARGEPMARQYLLFCGSCLLGALLSWAISTSLVEHTAVFHDWRLTAALIGIAAGTASNYLLSVSVVFRVRAKKGHEGRV